MFFPLNGIIMLCKVCNKTFKMFTQIVQFRANLKRAATLLENDDGENYKWCDYPMIPSYQQKGFLRQLFQERNLDPDEIERILEWRFPEKHIRNEFTNLNHLFDDEPYHHNNYNKNCKSSGLEEENDDDGESDCSEIKCKTQKLNRYVIQIILLLNKTDN